MAEDDKAPEEEAAETPQEPEEGTGKRGRKLDKPVSLFPLSFEEAVDTLFQTRSKGTERKKS